MIRFAANLISWIFHPLLIPSYLFTALSLHYPSVLQTVVPGFWIFLLMLLLTGILPALNILLLRMMGNLRDLDMPDQNDRVLPFVMVATIYGLVAYLFYTKYPAPGILSLLYILCTLTLLSLIINFFIKLSIHALSNVCATAVLTTLALQEGSGQLIFPVILGWLASGLVMSSRLALEAHTLKEIFIGAAVGFIGGTAGTLFFF